MAYKGRISIGDRLKIGDIEYLIASCGYRQAVLIDTTDGCRYDDYFEYKRNEDDVDEIREALKPELEGRKAKIKIGDDWVLLDWGNKKAIANVDMEV